MNKCKGSISIDLVPKLASQRTRVQTMVYGQKVHCLNHYTIVPSIKYITSSESTLLLNKAKLGF